MAQLLAALDDSAVARRVVAVAVAFGDLLRLQVVAVHASENGSGATAHEAADSSGVKFEMSEGDPASTLRKIASSPDVRALAIGARGPRTDRTPAGHVTLDICRRLSKPVIVVRPGARLPTAGVLRVLAPVDDQPATAAALRQLIVGFDTPALELVLLRVFDADHTPVFADHGTYDAEIWCDEFARTAVPGEVARTRVEMRVGDPADMILDAVRDLTPDLVVLAWRRNASRGHAAVITRLLSHAETPLVLLPAIDNANGPAEERQHAPSAGR